MKYSCAYDISIEVAPSCSIFGYWQFSSRSWPIATEVIILKKSDLLLKDVNRFMNSTLVDKGRATVSVDICVIHGSLRSSKAEGLLSFLTVRQRWMKLRHSPDGRLAWLNYDNTILCPSCLTRVLARLIMSLMFLRFYTYGLYLSESPTSSLNRVIPTAQMSTFSVYL